MGKTTVELVQKLQKYIDQERPKYEAGKLQKPSDFEKLLLIIEEARIGNYHDFLSPHAMPKMQLAQDLFDCGLLNTRQEVIDGLYDDEAPGDLPDQIK